MEQPEDSSNPAAAAGEHYLVAQATGVLLAQFALSPDAAFEKLRAEAARQGRPVTDVARDLVENCGPSAGANESR